MKKLMFFIYPLLTISQFYSIHAEMFSNFIPSHSTVSFL